MGRRASWFELVLALCVTSVPVVFAEPANAPVDPPQRNTPSDTRSYAAGQLIVKFSPSLAEDAADLVANGKLFADALPDRSASLDQLNHKAKVRGARSLFINRRGRSTAEAREDERRKLTRLQQRSRRRVKEAGAPPAPDLVNAYVLEVPQDADIEALAAEYRRDPHVEYAQPNYFVTANTIPNDPYYSSAGSWGQPYDDLWGLKKIQAESAWGLGKGQGTVVAVVDTGVDYTHPDLAANIWTNTGEVPANGIDDDHNGFIDDVRGWDISTCVLFGFGGYCAQTKPQDNDPMDFYGHGTHVSGTIAAVGDNGIGIIGVAPEAKIMPVKGLNDSGQGQISDLAAGIVYAAQNGADVINNSWGCGFPCYTNPVAEDAVRTAYALGSIMVFSAGNSSIDAALTSPQNMLSPKPIVVGASTETDAPAFFTNFGFLMDVMAPGGGDNTPPPNYDPFRNILSLRATQSYGAVDASGQLRIGQDYARQAGTSMAAPHVSGLAALVIGRHPQFSNEDVRRAIRASADDLSFLGSDSDTGAGRIQASRAMTINYVPQGKITSPAYPATVSANDGATLSIMGTSSGPAFSQYALAYTTSTDPGTQVPIGSPVNTPVVNGALGTWNVGTLPTDLYVLRLLTSTTEGFRFEDITKVPVERLVSPIVTGPAPQSVPVVSGNRVVWVDERNGNRDIYVYDAGTGVIRQLTTSNLIQQRPAIDGNRVVWIDERSGGQIFLYDLSTNTERQISTDPVSTYYDNIGLAISGTKIVWTDDRRISTWNTHYGVFLYDLATNTERELTNSTGNGVFSVTPSIDGNRVVWASQSGGGYSVYLYDLTTDTRQLIGQGGTDPWSVTPCISGDRIVWADNDANNQWDIYLYDLTTQTKRQITTNKANQRTPCISGNRIVWMDERNASADIYMYDLTTGTERPVAVHPSAQTNPKISGNRVVWEDYRNMVGSDWLDFDIYQAVLPAPSLFVPMANPVTAQVGALLSFSVKGIHPAGGALQLSVSGLPVGAKFLPLGDVTMDTAVASVDATWIGEYLGGTRTFSAEQKALADVDRSGTVTQADVTVLNSVLAGTTPPLNTSLLLWVPTTTQGGRDYPVTFTAQDAGVGPESRTITFSVQGANLLTNGSFEQGKTDWTGWGTSKQLVTETAYAGANSLKFILDDVRVARAVEHDPMANLPTGKYQLRAAVRSDLVGPTSSVWLFIEWRDAQRNLLGTTTVGQTYGTTTGNWVPKSSGVMTPPAGTSRVNISVRALGTGTAYVDDVRLERAF